MYLNGVVVAYLKGYLYYYNIQKLQTVFCSNMPCGLSQPAAVWLHLSTPTRGNLRRSPPNMTSEQLHSSSCLT